MTPPKRRSAGVPANNPTPSAARLTATIAAPPTVLPPSASRRVLAWSYAIIGIGVFIVGWIGAQTGEIAVPGDRHHVLSQIVAAGLVALGVRIGSGPTSRRASR